MHLLFIHGAGGYVDDRMMADRLGEILGIPVSFPRFPDDDMAFEAWAAPIRGFLAAMTTEDLVVAHSFGASILLRVLAERGRRVPSRAVLLAMPDWSPNGWDVEEYAYTGPEPDVALSLHHCRDDEVVPFGHLALNAARLPAARKVGHPSGGHQFEGVLEAVVRDSPISYKNGRN